MYGTSSTFCGVPGGAETGMDYGAIIDVEETGIDDDIIENEINHNFIESSHISPSISKKRVFFKYKNTHIVAYCSLVFGGRYINYAFISKEIKD